MKRKRNAPENDASDRIAAKPDIPKATKEPATEDERKPKRRARAKPLPKEQARKQLEFQRQYLQGRDHDHPALKSLGCGTCKLITGDLKSMSPMDGAMRLEVETGLRFHEAYHDEIAGQTFMIPAAHIEEIFTRRNPDASAPEEEAMQFIIIPVAMTGASAIRRRLPLPVIFNAPNTAPTGKILEYGRGETSQDAIIENVLNAEFFRIGKGLRVQRLPALATEKESSNGSGASWQVSNSLGQDAKGREQDAKGSLYLTERGILFLVQEVQKTMYLPFRSIKNLTVIVIKDLASAKKSRSKAKNQPRQPVPVEINLIVRATEPWYDEEADSADKKESSKVESHTIVFTRISLDWLSTIKEYMSSHEGDLKYELCQMKYYDFDAGHPMTGWEPVQED